MADVLEQQSGRKSHMLFFRGGYAHANNSRTVYPYKVVALAPEEVYQIRMLGISARASTGA